MYMGLVGDVERSRVLLGLEKDWPNRSDMGSCSVGETDVPTFVTEAERPRPLNKGRVNLLGSSLSCYNITKKGKIQLKVLK